MDILLSHSELVEPGDKIDAYSHASKRADAERDFNAGRIKALEAEIVRLTEQLAAARLALATQYGNAAIREFPVGG